MYATQLLTTILAFMIAFPAQIFMSIALHVITPQPILMKEVVWPVLQEILQETRDLVLLGALCLFVQ